MFVLKKSVGDKMRKIKPNIKCNDKVSNPFTIAPGLGTFML